MTTNQKLVIAIVALSIALVCVIGGTLAFLIDSTETVTNTFTYGEIDIELWENTVDDEGNLTETKDYDGIVYGKIVAGDVVKKNPTVTVKEGSEECYVYVKVTDTLAVDSVVTDMSIGEYNDWQVVKNDGNVTLYRYKTTVKAPAENNDSTADDINIAVFTKVTFPGELTNDQIKSLKADGNKIEIQAYAHQSDNTNVDVADAAAINWAGIN